MLDGLLDAIADIRDEYARQHGDALSQVEMWAAKGDLKEVAHASADAERAGYAFLASKRILELVSDRLSKFPADPDEVEEQSFWRAYEQYNRWREDKVFPRPTLFHHLRKHMINAAVAKAEAPSHD